MKTKHDELAMLCLWIAFILLTMAASGCTITVKVVHETPMPQFRMPAPMPIDTSWYIPYRVIMDSVPVDRSLIADSAKLRPTDYGRYKEWAK